MLLAEFIVNGELLLDDGTFPIGSLVGALLLRRLIGTNAAMDRVGQVGGMLVALGIATAISATAGTVSMVAVLAARHGAPLRSRVGPRPAASPELIAPSRRLRPHA